MHIGNAAKAVALARRCNEFVAALRAAGVPVTVLDAQDLNHDEVSVNIGAPGDTVMTPAVMEFLTRCFTTERQ